MGNYPTNSTELPKAGEALAHIKSAHLFCCRLTGPAADWGYTTRSLQIERPHRRQTPRSGALGAQGPPRETRVAQRATSAQAYGMELASDAGRVAAEDIAKDWSARVMRCRVCAGSQRVGGFGASARCKEQAASNFV